MHQGEEMNRRDITIAQSATKVITLTMAFPNAANPTATIATGSWQGRLDIRAKELRTSTLLHRSSTDNAEIVIGGTNALVNIKIQIPYETTSTFDFKQAYYTLGLIDGNDIGYVPLYGAVTVVSSVLDWSSV